MFRLEEIGLGFKDSCLEFKIYDIKFKIIIQKYFWKKNWKKS